MIFRRLRIALLPASLALGAFLSAYGQSKQRPPGQPILFSEPRRNTATSNLNEIVAQKTSPKNLGQEFKKPSDILDAGDLSLGANTITPPLRQLPPPKLSSKRLKELLDKRNDRAFETPEDLLRGLSAEEIFKITEIGPDGREKQKTSAEERYYDRLVREHHGTTNQMKGDDPLGLPKQDDGKDDLASGPGASARAPTLKPFGTDAAGAFSSGVDFSRSLSEAFGFGNVESPAATRARETRLQDFKQLLDSRALPPLATSPLNTAPVPALGSPATRGFDSLPGMAPRDLSSPLPGTMGAPRGLPEMGNQKSLAPPPPRVPLTPVFEIPKRKF